MFLKVGEWAMLRLHKGYNIPATLGITKKIAQQYVGPFQVVERIGRLAYRLAVPEEWKVHPVFTVAQLEPCPAPSDDPFQRPRPGLEHPPPVSTDLQSYEIERLLNRRIVKKGRGLAKEYLIRWKGYGPEFDKWYNVKRLDQAPELVKEYEEEFGPIPIEGLPKPKGRRGRQRGLK